MDCLKATEFLLSSEEYKGAVNRAYYVAFHAVKAMLVLDGFDSKKHSDIIDKFRELYLKTDLSDKEFTDSISSLFKARMASDYDDFYIVTKSDAIAQYEKAKKILISIENYLYIKWNLNFTNR